MACRMREGGSEVTPSQRTRALRVALVGGMIEPLRLLLEDVLTDGGVRYELTSQPGGCDVVIVMVNGGEDLHVIAEAHALRADVPLLAVLPFGDDDLARRVLLGGAQGWFSLDTPLALLRASLDKLADLGRPADPEAD